MTTQLLVSILFINIALLFYSVAVWSEFRAKNLRPWHVVFFWLGVISDTAGTKLMVDHVGYIKFNVHTSTGFIGVLLMIVHAIWATKVMIQNEHVSLRDFHKLSVLVWLVWFLSYISGLFMGAASI